MSFKINDKGKKFLKKHKTQEDGKELGARDLAAYHDTLYCVVAEFAEEGTLGKFLTSKVSHKMHSVVFWQTMLFQILSVLATIQYHFPTFRHNDCHVDNWLVQKLEPHRSCFIYVIGDKIFKAKNEGFQIMMWDFDFASMDPQIKNIRTTTYKDQGAIGWSTDHFTDMHMVLNGILLAKFHPSTPYVTNMKKFKSISHDLAGLLETVVPEELYGNHTTKLFSARLKDRKDSKHHQRITPKNLLLNHPFFRNMQITQEELNILISKDEVAAIYDMTRKLPDTLKMG